MSIRRFYYTTPAGERLAIEAGWDRPLQYHFLLIFEADARGALRHISFSNLALPDPAMTLNDITHVLHRYGIVPPTHFILDLASDQLANRGNRYVLYEHNTARLVRTRADLNLPSECADVYSATDTPSTAMMRFTFDAPSRSFFAS